MATINCYSGPNPVTDEQRRGIWAWAKENAIDKGMTFDQIHKAINDQFFSGMARPEWINDILGGRKTPYREIANDLWKKQYNRQTIVRQAEDLSKLHGLGMTSKAVRALWTLPRQAAVAGHGLVYPVTHAGDLLLNPAAWNVFMRNTLRAYSTVAGKGRFARSAAVRTLLENDPLFARAARSGLDVKPDSKATGLINAKYGKTGVSDRIWEALKLMRFELWKQEREQVIRPDTTEAQMQDIDKKLAEWANHATGSASRTLPNIGPLKAGDLLFGPKLTASKLARVVADPLETVKTLANWNKASPGDKAVAFTRFRGAAASMGTLLAGLTINGAINQIMGSKQKVNITDPMASDFLEFKGLGLEGTIPGVTSEARTFGKMIATAMMGDKDFYTWAKHHGEEYPSKMQEFYKEAGRYAMSKTSPTLAMAAEVPFKESAVGVPMPWSPKPGKPGTYFQRMDVPAYLLSHAPIPLSGPVGWLYNKWRNQGMSAFDTANLIRGLAMTALGVPGFHVHEEPEQDYQAAKQTAKRAQVARTLQRR